MQPQGERSELQVGIGDGTEHLLAFVFAHRIRLRGGELPQPYHPRCGIPPPGPGPVKNTRQEPRRGVFSAWVDPNYLGIQPSEEVLMGLSALAAVILAAPQPLDIDHLAATADLGQRPAPRGRVGLGEVEPSEFALEPEDLLLDLDGSFGGRGLPRQPAAQLEGDVGENGVGLGHRFEQF